MAPQPSQPDEPAGFVSHSAVGSGAFAFGGDLCCRNPGGPGCCLNADGDGESECGGEMPGGQADAMDAAFDSPGPFNNFGGEFQHIGAAVEGPAGWAPEEAESAFPDGGPRNLHPGAEMPTIAPPAVPKPVVGTASPRNAGGRKAASPGVRTRVKSETADSAAASDDGNGAGAGDGAEADGKKRRKVPNSCTHCKRSHLSCDPFRPCLRCARKGLVCVDSVPKVPAPRGQGPKAREKARLAELRRLQNSGKADEFECTMDEDVATPVSSVFSPRVSRVESFASSLSPTDPQSPFEAPTPRTEEPPAARISGIIRPNVTKRPKQARPAPQSQPQPQAFVPGQFDAGALPAELLAQLSFGPQVPYLPFGPSPALAQAGSFATSGLSSADAGAPLAASSNPMLAELTDLDALAADLLAGGDFVPPADPHPMEDDGASVAPSDWTSRMMDPPQQLSALPDPIGFDIEDLGNSRFVDMLVFGSAGGTGGEDDGASAAASHSQGRGKKATRRRAESAAQGPGFGGQVAPACFGMHGPDEACEGCPFSLKDRFYLLAAGDASSAATTLADPDACASLTAILELKHRAGLLAPHSHAGGYARLLKWLDDSSGWPASERDRVRASVGELWNAYDDRAADAQGPLLSAEHTERLCLLADRLFSATGVPAAMWRRTGELLRANREFAALVGVPVEELLGASPVPAGRTSKGWAVYELLDGASAAALYEAFVGVAADPSRKAGMLPLSLTNRLRPGTGTIRCSASFTVHREPWSGAPAAVVGNFLPCEPPHLAEMLAAGMAPFAGAGKGEVDEADEVRRLLGMGRGRKAAG
ncbi:hypothetical protein DFJ74DRAFT_684052 [Hyaloraphidium curvatum]|nr:hypothetical protein DFJ74DRAFT_684052 [Hyaloraphidium curvatum]